MIPFIMEFSVDLILQNVKDVKASEISMKWKEIFEGSNEFVTKFSLELTALRDTY